MKREQRMKNLWTKSAEFLKGLLIHTGNMESGTFIPISNVGQCIDPSRHFGVFPLRGVSY